MAESFSDEELCFLRHVRFGELPARVRPEDMVETQETDVRRDLPDGTTRESIALRQGWAY
jgi:hypothetical protein